MRKSARLISLLLFVSLMCPYISAAAFDVDFVNESVAAVDIADSYTDFGILTSDLKNNSAGVRVILKASAAFEGDFSEEPGALRIIDGPDGYYVVLLTDSASAAAFAQKQSAKPEIEYADVEELLSTAGATTANSADNEYNSWGVSAVEADVFADYLNCRGIDTNVIVAVVDTGVASHSFLDGKVIQGYDFSDGDQNSSNDADGHGTHVAGTVIDCAAGTDIKVMAVRVLDNKGWGEDIDIANGVRYACDNGAKIINLSLSGDHASNYLEDVVAYVTKKGCTVVCAAGNENSDVADACPGHIAEAITVAAVDNQYARASFSNFGDAIDIAAPGVNIKSTKVGGGFVSASGTSMSAPHISACAAMLKALYPSADAGRIDELLSESALDLGAVGFDSEYGAGVPKLSSLIPEDYSLSSIEVVSNQRQSYYIGDDFYKSGLTVCANHADGVSYNITGYTLAYDFSEAGAQTVSVEYSEGSITARTDFEVTVKTPEIILSEEYIRVYAGTDKNVTFSTQPPSSQVRLDSVNDGYTAQSSNANVISVSGIAEGSNTINVVFTYNGIEYSAALDVLVEPMPTVKSIEITEAPAKTAYYIGDRLDTSGITVMATMLSGEKINLSGYQVGAVDMSTAGKKDVIVTFGEGSNVNTAGFSVNVYTPTVAITASKATVQVGETISISANYLPKSGGSFALRNVSGDEYFDFSSNGGNYFAKALRAGEAGIIAVLTYNEIVYTYLLDLTVIERIIRLDKLQILTETTSLNYGESVTFRTAGEPDDIAYTVRWSSSNPQIASVGQNGVVTAAGNGTAVITATATDEKGNTLSQSVSVSCKMTLWQRIVVLFRMLFGASMWVTSKPVNFI